MDAPDMRQWIDVCIEAAQAEMVGDLTPEVLTMPGMTCAIVRSFLHHLTGHPKLNRYAEVGAHMGATACAAGSATDCHVSVCDNFSQFQMVDFAIPGPRDPHRTTVNVEDVCRGNLDKYLGDRCTLYTGDSVEWDIGPQDVLFYDGDHSEDATYANLVELVPRSNCRVLIVDDFAGDGVAAGTIAALTGMAARGDWQPASVWHRSWWNGVLIAVRAG